MKIGITERGDPVFHYAELNKKFKNNDVDGAIIITKNITNKKLQKFLLNYKNKIILHSSITFLGQSIIEPNVPKYQNSLKSLEELVNSGFNSNHIVFRLDPIIGQKQINNLINNLDFIKKLNINRIRFSFCQFYQHVKDRFLKNNIPLPKLDINNFNLNSDFIYNSLNIFETLSQKYDIIFESCGQNIPNEFKIIQKNGCISEKDLNILNLNIDNTIHLPEFKQRRFCNCLNVKTELLTEKKQCKHGCLYCYWKSK